MVLTWSEERPEQRVDLLEATLELAPVPLALIGPSGGALLVNDQLGRILSSGGAVSEAAIAASLTSPFRTISHQLISGGSERCQVDHLAVLPGGGRKWLRITASPVRSGESLQHIIAHVQELDERGPRVLPMHADPLELRVIEQIRRALLTDDLVLHAQPIIDLRSGGTFAEELLVRMRADTGEIIGPSAFLPVAERTGLVTAIDRWVVASGIGRAAAGHRVAINLSALSLSDPSLTEFVHETLERTLADPGMVIFEVTETAVVENLACARGFADRVMQLGCRLALDDFGTGFGTLTTAKALPVSLIKVDSEFVHDILSDSRSECIVRSTIHFAHTLGAETVAEGVEDPETLSRLVELGVDYAQGYLLGAPAAIG